MKKNSSPIGIFDSGIGGLSILKAIQARLPKEDLIYIADSKYVPYGDKTKDKIKERVFEAKKLFASLNVKAIVLACNSATAAAGTELRAATDIPVIGLEPAIKPAIKSTNSNKIGVLATKTTLQSAKYQALKNRYGTSTLFYEKASSLFVDIVETASILDDDVIESIKQELEYFASAEIDCLVLGCTHYPFLNKIIGQILGTNVQIFETGEPVAKELERRLKDRLNSSNTEGSITYYSSAPQKNKSVFDRIMKNDVLLHPW